MSLSGIGGLHGFSIEPYGETAVIILSPEGICETAYRRLSAVSAAIKNNPPRGFLELVPAYDSLLYIFNALEPDLDSGIDLLRRLIDNTETSPIPAAMDIVDIPVAYGDEFGPDLERVAAQAGLEAAQVIAIHAEKPYLVYMLGFSPGFPYLGGMDARISAPRLATPRTAVPAGSVGIASSQTGVYPQESPGGWNLIGRTPLRLFDPDRQPPALLSAGQYVRFTPVSKKTFYNLVTPPTKPRASTIAQSAVRGIKVLKPGPLSTIQDRGRHGFQDSGVPPSGPMDSYSMQLANILAGNDASAAAIECTLGGLELQFTHDAVIALSGADSQASIDGEPVLQNRGVRVKKGSVLALGMAETGLRAYIAVRGGLAAESVLGSRSTFVRGGFGGLGGKALARGDFIPLADSRSNAGGDSIPLRILPQSLVPVFSAECMVRAIPSHESDRFTEEALASFFSQSFRVSTNSDRMACRLEGTSLEHVRGADIVSSGVLSGTVQVPPDGQAIVLLADRQTCGGYTRIAHVIQADLSMLGQARPGSRVRFSRCGIEEAREALRNQERTIDDFRRNISPAAQHQRAGIQTQLRVIINGVPFDTFVEDIE